MSTTPQTVECDILLDVIDAIQNGNDDFVSQQLINHSITSSSVDNQNVSLLHWAAINNRITIAQLLFDSGALINSKIGGGLLNESPLQWALRKKYYSMCDLLLQQGNVDFRKALLDHKSNEGCNALHLASRLCDINAIFLLINWGADVDSLDNDMNTPLLWLVKNKPASFEVQRLLIRFNCDITKVDDKKNTILHILANANFLDLSSIFQLYSIKSTIMKNIDGFTPYELAINRKNHHFVKFLFDMWFFTHSPENITIIITAFAMCVSFFFVNYYGIWLGFLFVYLSIFIVWRHLIQYSVVKYRDRIQTGFAVGCAILIIYSFRTYVSEKTSLFSRFLFYCFICSSCYCYYIVHKTKPDILREKNQSVLVQQILLASPQFGPNDAIENSINIEINDNADIESGNNTSITKTKKRGPILCTACLVDKRLASKHCEICGVCIIGFDRHCGIFGNCISYSNSRLLFFAMFSTLLTVLLYVKLSLDSYATVMCPSTHGFFYNCISVNYCLLFKHSGAFVMLMSSIMLVIFVSLMINSQISIIIRETTIFYYLKNRFYKNPPNCSESLTRIYNFIKNGVHKISFPLVVKLGNDEEETVHIMINDMNNDYFNHIEEIFENDEGETEEDFLIAKHDQHHIHGSNCNHNPPTPIEKPIISTSAEIISSNDR
jgi:palmitoyltransferase